MNENTAQMSNLTLGQFLSMTSRIGEIPPKVIIFENQEDMENFIQEEYDESCIIATFQSDMVPSYSFNERFLNRRVLSISAYNQDLFLIGIAEEGN